MKRYGSPPKVHRKREVDEIKRMRANLKVARHHINNGNCFVAAHAVTEAMKALGRAESDENATGRKRKMFPARYNAEAGIVKRFIAKCVKQR